MTWVRDIFEKLRAWGDAWVGGWFDPQPIQEIHRLDTDHGMRGA